MRGFESFDLGTHWRLDKYKFILKFCRLNTFFFLFYRWLLKALELYREMTLTDPQLIHACSPHSIRKLVYTVLSESRAIDLDFKPLFTESLKENQYELNETKKNDELFDSLQLLEKPKTKSKTKSTLTVYDVRTLSGCLLRVPEHFYTTIWHILTKVKGGIQIKDQHMPQEPTITHMAR